MKKQITRSMPDINEGLSSREVRRRVEAKLTNRTRRSVGKSYLQIIFSNIFTFFNFLGIIIFLIMLLCGSVTNMLFAVIIVANTAIGIFQEVRSKLAVERLSIVSEPTAIAVRDGKKQIIATSRIVADDILLYSAGKQVCCDGKIVQGEVEVNESMLTGESEPVKKRVGDIVYSGSFVVSGMCTVYCMRVGKENYIEQLSARVKKAKTPDSQLMRGIRSIIKCIAIIVFPLGIATFFCSNEIRTLLSAHVNIIADYVSGATVNINGASVNVTETVNNALKAMSGSMIGMVPSGMVLLTSVALAVAALKLARRKVLVRELACIEMLARVDTLCLDKTGTITDGSMTVEEIIPMRGYDVEEVKVLVKSLLGATGDNNMTARALNSYLEGVSPRLCEQSLPFSSSRKYSAATLIDKGTVTLGAAEFMFRKTSKEFDSVCNKLLRQGLRVLAVGYTPRPLKDDVADGLEPIAIVALQDTVRPDATQIIKWFVNNNVNIKVISGDNPLAVSVIAAKVGVAKADRYISLEGLSNDEVVQLANKYTVFGRVTPEQKALLIRSMKLQGHTVAMTGDGVNDILAMRESDCAISVGCGTDAAKTVANLVLTDSQFGSLPNVVREGRQVVNNIQNSSSLFLMKTAMTILTTLLCLIIMRTYPFEPQHLYALEFAVIGISSFMLALKPNSEIIRGKFVVNTLKKMMPSGLAMFTSIAMTYLFAGVLHLTQQQLSTVAMFSMTATGLAALWILLYPYGKYNIAVGVTSTLCTTLCYTVLPRALSIVARWLGDLVPSPVKVNVDGYAALFACLNVLVMSGLIVVFKVFFSYLDRKYPLKPMHKDNRGKK